MAATLMQQIIKIKIANHCVQAQLFGGLHAFNHNCKVVSGDKKQNSHIRLSPVGYNLKKKFPPPPPPFHTASEERNKTEKTGFHLPCMRHSLLVAFSSLCFSPCICVLYH